MGSSFRSLVLDCDRPLLDALADTKKTHNLVLRVQPLESDQVLTILAQFSYFGDNVWSMQLQNITRYANYAELPLPDFRDLLNSLVEPMLVVHEDKVCFMNTSFRRVVGLSEAMPVGSSAVCPASYMLKNIPDFAADPSSRYMQAQGTPNQVRRQDGSWIDVLSFTKVVHAGSQTYQVISIRIMEHTALPRDLKDIINDRVRNPLAGAEGLLENLLLQRSQEDKGKSRWAPPIQASAGTGVMTQAKELIKDAAANLSSILEGYSSSPSGEFSQSTVSAHPSQSLPSASPSQSSVSLKLLEPSWKVLIVDDSTLNSKILSAKFLNEQPFKSLKWNVTTTRTGEDVLYRLEHGEQYDLIVMDKNMEMAGGVLDGWETTKLVRAMESVKSSLLIIGATSHNSDNDVLDAKKAGQDAVWGKPYPSAEMMARTIVECMHFTEKKNYELSEVSQ